MGDASDGFAAVCQYDVRMRARRCRALDRCRLPTEEARVKHLCCRGISGEQIRPDELAGKVLPLWCRIIERRNVRSTGRRNGDAKNQAQSFRGHHCHKDNMHWLIQELNKRTPGVLYYHSALTYAVFPRAVRAPDAKRRVASRLLDAQSSPDR